MSLITEQQRIEIYRNAPEALRELYASDVLTGQVDVVYAKYEIAKPFKDFSEIIGDTILGFYKIADMPRLFEQNLNLTSDTAQKITAELIDYLSPVVKKEEQDTLGASAKKTDLQKLAEQFAEKSRRAQTVAPQVAPLQEHAPIVQRPVEQLEKVEPLRTMQGDINRIHGYGAYNEALESEQGGDEKQSASAQDSILSREN